MFFRKRKLKQQAAQENRVAAKRTGWFLFFRESLSGFILVTLVLVCFGFGAVLWGWAQRDQFLTDILRKKLQENYPEWNITFETAEIDNRGRIIISQLVANPEATELPLCQIDGLRITVDQDLLFNQRQLDVQSIEINRPKLQVRRESSGKWNWENLPAIEATKAALPVIKIRDATVAVQWEHEQFTRAVRVQVKAIDTDIIPVGKHRFRFQGIGREETLGTSQFAGDFDALHKNWSLSGVLKGLVIDQPFLEVATNLSADADRVLSDLKNSRLGTSPQKGRRSITQSGITQAAPYNQPQQTLSTNLSNEGEFSLRLMANLEFHLSQTVNTAPEFKLLAELVNGELIHPGLPIPLDKIEGRIAVDRLGLKLENIALKSGKTSAQISGAWGWQRGYLPKGIKEGFDVFLRDYQVTRETRNYLPVGVRKVFNELSPTGILSTSFHIKRGINKPIKLDLKSASVREASVQHKLFYYPIKNISGTIISTDNGIGPETWSFEKFTGGIAGEQVRFAGTLIDPGPNYETIMTFDLDRLPIDEQFYRALQPENRAVLEELNLQGMANSIRCTILRKLSIRQKPILRLEADVNNASIRVRNFPLAINEAQGHVSCDESGWQFTRLSGKHGNTQLNGFGSVVPENDQWRLKLTASAKQANFDQNLRIACQVASAEVTEVWNSLRPQGEFDISIEIDGLLGEHNKSLQVEIPWMKLNQCEITPTAFPWLLSQLDATVRVDKNGAVRFDNVKAVHELSRIETKGSFNSREDYWQLKFDQIVVDDLSPNHEFKEAIPEEFRKLLESMKIEDSASLAGTLEFKGDHQGKVVTAAWDATLVLNQADIFLGVDVEKVSGSIKFTGSLDRDGIATISDGKLALDSCWVKGYHITDVKGPFVIEKDRIVVGSEKMFDNGDSADEEEWKTISRDERVAGRIFGGELFLDLLALRTRTMPYVLRCKLSRADLEQWAIQNKYGQANIRGEINGYIDLAGDTVSTRNLVGNGELQISPAALYELPVVLQMIQKLKFTPVHGSAFHKAYSKYRVQDEKIIFDEIALLGDSISLLGKGYIRFDRTIDLDFVSRRPRKSRINVISQVLTGLERILPVMFIVDVTGTIDYPIIDVQDGVTDGVNGALKGFIKALETGPANLRPMLIQPPPRLHLPQQKQ